MLSDVTLKPQGDGKVERLVVILHGLGDSASGIIGLGESMRPYLPNTEFVAVNAPAPCDFSPFGYQWFSGEDWSPDAVLSGVKKAAKPLNDYLDQLMASRNLTSDKVALLGFSQGTMMSLYVAPRREKPFAGVLGYSGALIGGETLKFERKSSPPIMLIHGTSDEVVPFGALYAAVQGLQSVNINVMAFPCQGLGHSIDDAGLTQGVRFLRQVFRI